MITIPTLKQLYDQILNDLQGQYGVSIPVLGKNFLRSVAAVQAGKLKSMYLVLGKIQKNIAPDTADSELKGGTLERFGRIKLGRNPFAAVAAQYVVQVTGTPGAVIPASTTFKSDDNALNPGLLYILDNSYTLVSNPDTITLRALTAGTGGALNNLDTLTVTAPIANVDNTATVQSQAVQPLDAETIDTYRTEILKSYRLTPEGGAATDYILWAQDAQGVARVYPYAATGQNNEINLFVESIISDSTDGKGTPSNTMLNAVESVIEFNPDSTLPILKRGRRPLGVHQVNYLPVTPKDIDIVIAGYSGITTDIQILILNAITAQINKIRPFVAAADILANKNDIISINTIISTILAAQPGSIFTGATLKVNGVSVSSFQFLNGDIPYLNSVTYS
jgi:hypothetical protein